jgi:hypothetical protein
VYRQGDILLIQTDRVAAGEPQERRDGRLVIAAGEATGHAHAILDDHADILVSGEGAEELRLLVVGGDGPVALVHEEHATISVPPGVYEIRRKREYVSEQETRWVTD